VARLEVSLDVRVTGLGEHALKREIVTVVLE
jgi:hypothetical protein